MKLLFHSRRDLAPAVVAAELYLRQPAGTPGPNEVVAAIGRYASHTRAEYGKLWPLGTDSRKNTVFVAACGRYPAILARCTVQCAELLAGRRGDWLTLDASPGHNLALDLGAAILRSFPHSRMGRRLTTLGSLLAASRLRPLLTRAKNTVESGREEGPGQLC